MAMMDRIRERMRGQQPVGAAAQPVQQAQGQQGIRPGPAAPGQTAAPGQQAEEQMPMGTNVPDIRRRNQPMAAGMSDANLEMLLATKTTEAYEAGAMGERMGAESIMEMAGMTPKRRGEMAEGGRMHVMRRTVDEAYEQIQNEFGNYSTTQQTAEMIGLYVATKADIIYSNTAPTWLNRPAEPYSLRTYAVGEYCLQTVSGVTKSYRCTTAITTAHAWDASEWTVDVLPVAEGTIWVDTSPYLQTEADEYDPAETYNSGDQCEHDGSVYTCNTDSTTGTWDSTKWVLHESPVPKNQWNKYNGSSWENVTDNTRAKKWDGSTSSDSSFSDNFIEVQIAEGKSYLFVCYINLSK